jgi:hypothetical protein
MQSPPARAQLQSKWEDLSIQTLLLKKFGHEVRYFQIAHSGFLLLHDFSCDMPFVTHFFSKSSLATAMAVTALGHPE